MSGLSVAAGGPAAGRAPRSDAPILLPLEEGRRRMLDGLEPLPVETVALANAHGRVLAERVTSRLMVPPWDNSAMDGFALRAADTVPVDGGSVRLRVTGEAAAGRPSSVTVERGTAVRILTGAPLPAGADAIVPVEDTDAAPGAAALPLSVTIMRATTPGAHIRRAGSDLRAGAVLADRGRELAAAELAVIAAGGHGQVVVHRRPRVAVLATGDELVAPGEPLGPAQIPDSNTIGLLAQAREAGAEAEPLGIATDHVENVLGRLRPALDAFDVIVVSGGVSVGVHDVVKEAFAQLGTLELWRVAVQPGKPLAFGRAGTTLLFGLPGNPVSSHVTFELFVRPVVRRLAGHDDLVGREIVRAALADEVRKDPRRRAFIRVRLARTDAGGWKAALAGGQGSHVLSALAAADGLAVIPEGVDRLGAGAEVAVLRLRAPTASD